MIKPKLITVREFCAELRSGNWKQGFGCLCRVDNGEETWCPLGIGAAMTGQNLFRMALAQTTKAFPNRPFLSDLPKAMEGKRNDVEIFVKKYNRRVGISVLNDDHMSLPQIADAVWNEFLAHTYEAK